MSTNQQSGCGIWTFIGIFTVVFLAIATTDFRGNVSQFPQDVTTTSASIVVTLPTSLAEAPFEIENNQITYIYASNLGQPCYYEMSGQVFDMERAIYTDYIVNIKMIDDIAPEPSFSSPLEDGRWAMILPQSPVPYEIWLTSELDGEEISPHIIVYPYGCEHNHAIVNFIQTRPFP